MALGRRRGRPSKRPQPGDQRRGVPVDRDLLQPALCAGDEPDPRDAGSVERLGQQRAERRVGAAVLGRGANARKEHAVPSERRATPSIASRPPLGVSRQATTTPSGRAPGLVRSRRPVLVPVGPRILNAARRAGQPERPTSILETMRYLDAVDADACYSLAHAMSLSFRERSGPVLRPVPLWGRPSAHGRSAHALAIRRLHARRHRLHREDDRAGVGADFDARAARAWSTEATWLGLQVLGGGQGPSRGSLKEPSNLSRRTAETATPWPTTNCPGSAIPDAENGDTSGETGVPSERAGADSHAPAIGGRPPPSPMRKRLDATPPVRAAAARNSRSVVDRQAVGQNQNARAR